MKPILLFVSPVRHRLHVRVEARVPDGRHHPGGGLRAGQIEMAEHREVDQIDRKTLRRSHREEQGSDGPGIRRRTGWMQI